METVSTKKAADLLGIPTRSLNAYVKSDGAPKLGYDRFDIGAVIRWYAAYLRAQVQEARSGESEREAKRRIAVVKAESAEMDLLVKRGKLVDIDAIVHESSQFVAAAKARILAMGANLAPRILSCKTIMEVKTMIDDVTWDALNELSQLPMSMKKRQALVRKWEAEARALNRKTKTRE